MIMVKFIRNRMQVHKHRT